jgi:hypothetical protein
MTTEFKVGDAATYSVGSDRYPATVIDVQAFKSGPRAGRIRAITVQDDNAQVVSGNILDGSATYEYSRNTEGSIRTFTADKKGGFGKPFFRLYVGKRERYYDPHI